MRIRIAVAAVAAALSATALALVPATAAPAPESDTHGHKHKPLLYVSIGDSYAVGYQPVVAGGKGYAYQLPAMLAEKGYRNVKVVQFGCGGATSTSLIEQLGCPGASRYPVPNQMSYPTKTQIEAASDFIRRNRDRIALITVAIGGNDITACARAAEPVPCVATASTTVKANVTTAVRSLRKAAGAKVPIIGVTYPDVILGAWVNPGGADARTLANLSVVAFRSIINPALTEAYGTVNGTLVDVTAATGAYGSMDTTIRLKPYGVIPKPVAKVCELTYYCERMDIHATTKGYRIIARLIAEAMPAKR